MGTLECPPGFELDEVNGFCVPEDSFAQASDESAAPFKPTASMERCIQDVTKNLKRTRKTLEGQSIKSAAIAICRSRLKQ